MAAPGTGRRRAAPALIPRGHPRPAPWARFDDFAGGCAFELDDAQAGGVLVANDRREVVPVLEAAERAAAGGAWVAGFVSYEAAAGLDSALAVPSPPPAPAEVPLAWFASFASCRPVELVRSSSAGGAEAPRPGPGWTLTTRRADHARQVAEVKSLIAAGEVYQCNLTARYRAVVTGDPFDLYREMATAQRSGHCAYLDTGSLAVAGASPELFFEWAGDTLTVRPMKGTARRGRWAEEDEAFGAALQASAKDRAENVMIVDLLRNDLGKVAEYGTVTVPALCTLERYDTVWQLTSTVTARPRPDTTLADVFRALFPSGSVTGAPKRRAMQAIAGLEHSARGVYCGAVGLVAPPGAPFRARFNVAIRTAVVDRRSKEAVYGSGGGIVWDSRPDSEYAELEAKAAVLAPRPPRPCLLETMLALPGAGVRRWPRHRRRLAASADYFGVPLEMAAVDRALLAALSGLDQPARVRLVVDGDGVPAVEVGPVPAVPEGPVHLAVDTVPIERDGPWPFHKTTRRDPYNAAARRHPHADQVVLVNDEGQVTETTVANLAVRLDGRWWTPPIEAGCLPGVGRAELVEAGRLTECPVTVAELEAAEAVAVVSSLRGWRPAVVGRRAPAPA